MGSVLPAEGCGGVSQAAEMGGMHAQVCTSFSITARRCPWGCVRMWFSSVVLPEPRNPVITCAPPHRRNQ